MFNLRSYEKKVAQNEAMLAKKNLYMSYIEKKDSSYFHLSLKLQFRKKQISRQKIQKEGKQICYGPNRRPKEDP